MLAQADQTPPVCVYLIALPTRLPKTVPSSFSSVSITAFDPTTAASALAPRPQAPIIRDAVENSLHRNLRDRDMIVVQPRGLGQGIQFAAQRFHSRGGVYPSVSLSSGLCSVGSSNSSDIWMVFDRLLQVVADHGHQAAAIAADPLASSNCRLSSICAMTWRANASSAAF
jgi:hypothetical protein